MDIYFDSEVEKNFFREKVDDIHPSSIYVLTDHNTDHLCLPRFENHYLNGRSFHHISIPAGETEKNIKTCTRIWNEMIFNHADRNSLIINLGGGVLTDMGGFIASLYKRGCQFINIPTTLLGMVDASIGGKTGVDLGYLKNIIGVIQEPQFTFIDREFLNTLPRSEMESGWVELIKHALIADKDLWHQIKKIKKLSSLPEHNILSKGIQIKRKIVSEDFHEKNIRKTLNYGHTVGHAIESLMLSDKKPVKHGYAVATGIIIENIIAKNKGMMKENEKEEIEKFLNSKIPIIKDFSPEKVVRNMLHDKKNYNNEIRLSLVETIGHSKYDIPCSEKEAYNALVAFQNELSTQKVH